MVRALSLCLPWWSIERLKRTRYRHPYRQRAQNRSHEDAHNASARNCHDKREHQPCILLVRTVANRQHVVHACGRSLKSGVKIGMTLSHALALLPEDDRECAHVEEHDPQRDHDGLLKLAHWATRFAPLVAPDEHDQGLLINITGCARMYHGEAQLLKYVLNAVKRLRLTTRAAIAPSYGAAWALARFGTADVSNSPAHIVERVEELPEVLSPLSVAGLRLDEDMIDALDEVGVRTIGQLMAIPRRQLPSRFSSDLVLRLDQALGHAVETIASVQVAQPICTSIEFAGPVKDLEVIQLAVQQLLEEMGQRLLQHEGGVRRLVVAFDRYECKAVNIPLVLSRPTRDIAHLRRLLEPKVEQLNLGRGIEAIDMEAREWSRLAHRQNVHPTIDSQSIEREALDEEEGRLLDTLMHRLGHSHVSRMWCTESHLPERVTRLVAADKRQPGMKVSVTRNDRPTQLLERPEPVEVQSLTPDGPMLQIRWRGQWLRAVDATSPERVNTEWWREANTSRDYFKVAIESGDLLWLYRDNSCNCWFVHGRWT